MKQQSSSILTLAFLLAAGGTTLKVGAQSAVDNFPLPKTVAAGTKVQIDGSSSMQTVNQNLREKFQTQFPGTDVVIPSKYQGSDAGIKALVDDKADLASIGRLLTSEEKAKGLAAKTIGRTKIAIIVKDNNPYTGNLTLTDFAKIYRGEVTDWSQLPSAKGAKGKIKVIDRPDSSDTRRAFANYPVFQNGKLKTGGNADKLTEDSTQAVVDKLGQDGIGYAPADQIKNISGIRAVTLHSTQPDNPKYPFSQPLVYAYKNKGGTVKEGAKAFLGYASDPTGQAIVNSAIPGSPAAPVSPVPAPSSAPVTTGTTAPPPSDSGAISAGGNAGNITTTKTTTTTTTKGGFPLWLLPLVGIGGGLLWLFGRKKPTETVTTVAPPETTPGLKPLYPPPPTRTTSTGDGLSGDLSGDLSSGLGGFRPSGDLRSGDLRSGDLGSTLPPPPNFTPPTAPNPNFNGLVDPVKGSGINIPGVAAAGAAAAAAAAAGKSILDGRNEPSGELRPPEIKTPDIDLSNPLEGLKDKSSNLRPNLDFHNPLEGIKDKAGDLLKDGKDKAGDLFNDGGDLLKDGKDKAGDIFKDGTGTAAAAGAAALAGGAALASGAGKSIGNFFGKTEEAVEDVDIKLPKIGNPLDGIKDKVADLKNKAADLVPDLKVNNPLDGIKDKAADLKNKAADLVPDLKVNSPLDGIKDKATDLQDRAADLVPDLKVNNPLDGMKDKAGDFLKGGGAAGVAALAGGAALATGMGKSVGDFFGGSPEEEDRSEELWLENPNTDQDDLAMDLSSLDEINDPFDLSDFQQPEALQTPDPLDLSDFQQPEAVQTPDPFDLSDFQQPEALQTPDPLDLSDFHQPEALQTPDPLDLSDFHQPEALQTPEPIEFDLNDPFAEVPDNAGDLLKDPGTAIGEVTDKITDKAGDVLKDSGAAIGAAGAAVVAGGAALLGNQQPAAPEDFDLSDMDMDTFDRDLESISLDGLDDDPFSGLSDLLGEETGEVGNDYPKPDSSNPLSSIKDKAADLLADGKDLGGAALAGGAAAALGATQAVQSFFKNDTPVKPEEKSPSLYSEGQITLVSPSPTQAYAHWEIPVRLKQQLREQGGQKLVVRLYDVTNVDPKIELPTTFKEFECNDLAWDLELPIDQSEHRYVTEIGYVTTDGRWLMLARSAPLWIPAT